MSKMQKKDEIDLLSLVKAFPQTRKVYKEIGEATSSLRITGLRQNKGKIVYKRAAVTKTAELPTIRTARMVIEDLTSKKGNWKGKRK